MARGDRRCASGPVHRLKHRLEYVHPHRLGPVCLICTGPHLHNLDSVTTQKQITMNPNQKPWMKRDVFLLLKAHDTAFRSGDAQAYSTARAELKRGIKKAKHHYKGKVEEHFSNSNPRRMWQGLQIITYYRTINPPLRLL